MAEFKRVAYVSDIPRGEGVVVKVDGCEVAVFNVNGEFYAIGNTCTHRGGPLAEGNLRGKVVTCPWHGAQFDVTTGEVVSPPAPTDQPSYPTKVENGAVWVLPIVPPTR
jgi:nitrite reductase/ring-hydroxylating ferredoxin subunit